MKRTIAAIVMAMFVLTQGAPAFATQNLRMQEPAGTVVGDAVGKEVAAAGANGILTPPKELIESVKGIARQLIKRTLRKEITYEDAIAEALKNLNQAEQNFGFPAYSTSSEFVKAIRGKGVVGDSGSTVSEEVKEELMDMIKLKVTAQNHKQFGNRLVNVAVILTDGEGNIILKKADDGRWTLPETQTIANEDISNAVFMAIRKETNVYDVIFEKPLTVVTNPVQFEKYGVVSESQPYSYTIVTLARYSEEIKPEQGQISVFNSDNIPSQDQISPNYYDIIKGYLGGRDLTIVEPSKTMDKKIRVDKNHPDYPRHVLAGELVSGAIERGSVPPVLTVDLIVNLHNDKGESLGIPLIIRGAERPDGKRPDRWMREIGKLAIPGGFMENANTPEVIALEEFNAEVTQYLKKAGIEIRDFTLKRLLTVASDPSRDDMLYTWSIVFEAEAAVETSEEALKKLREGIVDLSLKEEVLGIRLVTQAPIEEDMAFDHRIILEDYFNQNVAPQTATAAQAGAAAAGEPINKDTILKPGYIIHGYLFDDLFIVKEVSADGESIDMEKVSMDSMFAADSFIETRQKLIEYGWTYVVPAAAQAGGKTSAIARAQGIQDLKALEFCIERLSSFLDVSYLAVESQLKEALMKFKSPDEILILLRDFLNDNSFLVPSDGLHHVVSSEFVTAMISIAVEDTGIKNITYEFKISSTNAGEFNTAVNEWRNLIEDWDGDIVEIAQDIKKKGFYIWRHGRTEKDLVAQRQRAVSDKPLAVEQKEEESLVSARDVRQLLLSKENNQASFGNIRSTLYEAKGKSDVLSFFTEDLRNVLADMVKNGEVEIISEIDGDFTMYKLAASKKSKPVRAGAVGDTKEGAQKGAAATGKVLVVDDNWADRGFLVRKLKRDMGEGVEIIEAASVKTGTEIWDAQGPFAAVFTDFDLRDGYGTDLVKHINPEQREKSIPIVVLTNHINEEKEIVLRMALDDGCIVGYSEKDFSSSEFTNALDKIKGILDSQQRIQNGIAVVITQETVLDPNRMVEIQQQVKPFGYEFKEIVPVSESKAINEIARLRADGKTIVVMLNDTGNTLSETIKLGVGNVEIIDISSKAPSEITKLVEQAV